MASFAMTLCGCFSSGSTQADEEKEPHFQQGRSRVNGMDYGGAIESFEKTLEVSPQHAQAHFELGWLYADKQPEPAAAIFHYEQYLKLRPNADNAETIRQHIFRLKQDLAKAVLPLPSTPGVQRQLEQLMEENRRLNEEVKKWREYYASRGLTSPPTNAPSEVAEARPAQTGGGATVATAQQTSASVGNRSNVNSSTSATARQHRVAAGETPSSIARKYNVKLDALLAANPGLDPRRMQVGQTLKVPSP
jgi:LysM repeat protein